MHMDMSTERRIISLPYNSEVASETEFFFSQENHNSLLHSEK